jgi:hypothetical protein
MRPLIVSRVHCHPAACAERWEVSCPHASTAPIRFWWSDLDTNARIVQAARQALKKAKHEDDPVHDREFVIGNRIPQD